MSLQRHNEFRDTNQSYYQSYSSLAHLLQVGQNLEINRVVVLYKAELTYFLHTMILNQSSCVLFGAQPTHTVPFVRFIPHGDPKQNHQSWTKRVGYTHEYIPFHLKCLKEGFLRPQS